MVTIKQIRFRVSNKLKPFEREFFDCLVTRYGLEHACKLAGRKHPPVRYMTGIITVDLTEWEKSLREMRETIEQANLSIAVRELGEQLMRIRGF